MNPNEPETWDNIADHPVFEIGGFDSNWYDGNMTEDLSRLKNATRAIRNSFPKWTCELIVLDDCTMYVNFMLDGTKLWSLYPAMTDDFDHCFFLDIPESETELRVKTHSQLIGVLRDRYQ